MKVGEKKIQINVWMPISEMNTIDAMVKEARNKLSTDRYSRADIIRKAVNNYLASKRK